MNMTFSDKNKKEQKLMHLYEKTTESKIVYDGKIFKIKSDKVLLENNTEAVREVIMHHGGVCVLPLTENNEIIMVKQYRYPFSSVLLEIPAGKLNENEDHLECGKRELLEETGAVAEEMIYLGPIYPIPAYVTEQIHVYIAKGLSFHSQNLDADEFLDVVKIPFDEALRMVLDNEIKDGKTQIAIMKAGLMQK